MKNNIEDSGDLKSEKAGFWGMFPTVDSFIEYKNLDHDISNKTLPKIICYAFQKGLIENENESAFLRMIRENELEFSIYAQNYKRETSFSDILNGVIRQNPDRYNQNTIASWLSSIARRFNFEKIQSSMMTRLKTRYNPSAKKQSNFFRLFAYWVCKNHPELGWNYEQIIDTFRRREKEEKPDETEGVRISFFISGHPIEAGKIDKLADELKQSISDLKLSHLYQTEIKSSATTAFLDIPKKPGPSGEPGLYGQAARDSLALAHQMAVRWDLMEQNVKQYNHIVIAIVAGEFISSENTVHVLQKAEIPGFSIIRLNDFALLCARIADVKVVFSKDPHIVNQLYEKINVWSVDSFWSFAYWDFIPRLLEPDMLPADRRSYSEFKEAVYYSSNEQSFKFKALAAIQRSPQNIFLISEIVKICIARKMFFEANTLLSFILSLHPNHLISRTTRMDIFLFLALDQTDLSSFKLFLLRALDEAKYIMRNCAIEDEEFYCQLGLLHFSSSLRVLAVLKDKAESVQYRNEISEETVLSHLKKGEKYLKQGCIVSPSGIANRSSFWLCHVKCFRKLLENNHSLFKPDTPLKDTQGVYQKEAMKFYFSIGWSDSDSPEMRIDDANDSAALLSLSRRVEAAVKTYFNSVLLRTYIPNVKFAFATVYIDFSPVLTVGTLKEAHKLLDEARRCVEQLAGHPECVYTTSNCFVQLESPEQFLKDIDGAISLLTKTFGDDLQKENDFHELDRKKLDGRKMILLNAAKKEVESGPIF